MLEQVGPERTEHRHAGRKLFTRIHQAGGHLRRPVPVGAGEDVQVILFQALAGRRRRGRERQVVVLGGAVEMRHSELPVHGRFGERGEREEMGPEASDLQVLEEAPQSVGQGPAGLEGVAQDETGDGADAHLGRLLDDLPAPIESRGSW